MDETLFSKEMKTKNKQTKKLKRKKGERELWKLSPVTCAYCSFRRNIQEGFCFFSDVFCSQNVVTWTGPCLYSRLKRRMYFHFSKTLFRYLLVEEQMISIFSGLETVGFMKLFLCHSDGLVISATQSRLVRSCHILRCIWMESFVPVRHCSWSQESLQPAVAPLPSTSTSPTNSRVEAGGE